ncbi:2,3,4,5-tetrahydropyridine-2,6-dicarboxylate N-succinyltransferase [Candidatus Erwinia haradaeae]|uniref:2,3,4,5-tetrahydropyridine-2,6-dicarboxylate N-succinyltransferase n=1 Tax=Candidatus Erwinia haradaeae TaxID=1922217 RepID=A0A451D224_9GAMM|nr:2,3,4,5-tetrahydropyridine-2,6-dicarboxylate N-succinyltransferase [Candidatus Erwinia haradaeae]VFP79657.1 2,3,4,5-tetrahydropyridine-2,6-dicarboxylate N-succinyltransferase [Candidatus Erwinia haradaeae]
MKKFQKIIEDSFENHLNLTSKNVDQDTYDAVNHLIFLLDTGELRVSEKINDKWITHQWLKKAIFLFFCIHDNQMMGSSENPYYDKIPRKFTSYNEARFKQAGIRIVPPAAVRYGAYISRNTILMPSYINIGAYVDEGTLVDTWATIGSCAQIGKNVHLSGGVGIGGVLEPIQSNPTIIEDNCFIGARSEIVEGVVVEEGSVISMGVYIGQSTKIYDRENDTIYYGYVPAGSVVVAGNLPSKNYKCSLYCAVIVKKVDTKTLLKTGINQLLRSID